MHAALIGVFLVVGSQPATVDQASIVEFEGAQPAVSHQVPVAYPVVTSYPTGSFPALRAYYCRGAFDYRRTFDFPWRPYRAVKTNRWVVPAAGATVPQEAVPYETGPYQVGSGTAILPGPPQPDPGER